MSSTLPEPAGPVCAAARRQAAICVCHPSFPVGVESDAPGAFLERYGQVDSALRAYGPALTRGLVTARYLGLSAGMLDGVSRLVGPLCYTGQPAQLRYAAENSLPLNALWSMGISGDLPILLLECREGKDLSLVQLLLRAHAWYRMHGLWWIWCWP